MNGTCTMFWIYPIGLIIFCSMALNGQVTNTNFSCRGRTSGYYADIGSGCRVYHMCDGLGRQFSYTCPNATLFQQRMLICDHWYMVNCSTSENDYAANLRIGQREMPFVDDSESNPYHRTPRPDLLSHPRESEYDIIYRTGRTQLKNDLNLVGAETDRKNASASETDLPTYNPPSHWSTEFSPQQSTLKPLISKEKPINFNIKKNIENSSNIKGKPIVPFNAATEPSNVNFKSSFKATTPVFPKSVESTTVAPDTLGILPPIPYQLIKTENENKNKPIRDNNIVVNFESNFTATTPVYPTSVEVTSVEPKDLGILPPLPANNIAADNSNNQEKNENIPLPELNLEFLPPKIDNTVKKRNLTDENVPVPSKFYQPPKFEPDYTDLAKQKIEKIRDNNEVNSRQSSLKSFSNQQWADLKKKFFIPDYDFPLESVSRPSYDSVLSSFQVDTGPPKEKR